MSQDIRPTLGGIEVLQFLRHVEFVWLRTGKVYAFPFDTVDYLCDPIVIKFPPILTAENLQELALYFSKETGISLQESVEGLHRVYQTIELKNHPEYAYWKDRPLVAEDFYHVWQMMKEGKF